MNKEVKNFAPKKKVKRKVRKSFIAAVLVLLLVIFVILLTTVLLPIKTITVNYSGKKYTKEQILQAANIKAGDNYIMLSPKDVNRKVTEQLPYIGSVEIKKQFPDKVLVVPKETSAAYCIKANKKFVILDKNYKVLQISNKKPKNIIYIKGLKFSKYDTGKIAEFSDEDVFNTSKSIIEYLNKTKFNLNYINITSKFNIKLVINNKYQVDFGSSTESEEKLEYMVKTLKDIEKKHKNQTGKLNMSYYSATKDEAYFRKGEIDLEP